MYEELSKKEFSKNSTLKLHTGAWYGDQMLELGIPQNWDVKVLWPQTPLPLTEYQIAEILKKPVGQKPIHQLCRGKSRPLIVVDDLNRPTPAEKIIPILLRYFEEANIPLKNVTILMATGSHGKPGADAMFKKVGAKAAESCQLLIHDCFKGNRKIGETSFGTKVYVNNAVLESDFILGIGGIYPNWQGGFGGGTKLALGVLGLQSIFSLHFRHQEVRRGILSAECSFRKDLNEISKMIGLETVISVQVNSDREIIRVDSGDPLKYYPDSIDFCYRTFRTSSSSDADVIISNTYPCDVSLTFARMKGFAPFEGCKSSASRVAIASCAEGLGIHNIFPNVNKPHFHQGKQLYRFVHTFGFGQITRTMLRKKIRRKINSVAAEKSSSLKRYKDHDIILHIPEEYGIKFQKAIPGITQMSSWPKIVQMIQEEQQNKHLKVIVYPCAFLQFSTQSY